MDMLISHYYYFRDREIPFDNVEDEVREFYMDINNYVYSMLLPWIGFVKLTLPYATSFISYEMLMYHPETALKNLFSELGFECNDEILKKAIEFSKKDNIKTMADNTGQTYGMADRYTFKGKFIRSGKIGQFIDELDPETIDMCRWILEINNVDAYSFD